MLAIAQNELRVIEINEVILVVKGGPYDQEIEIRPIDSVTPIAIYNNKNRALDVLKQYLKAKKRVYKLENAKDLLTDTEINEIIENDYIFQFPEK